MGNISFYNDESQFRIFEVSIYYIS